MAGRVGNNGRQFQHLVIKSVVHSHPSHPGDRAYQRHPLFEEYVDVCSDSPGADKPWAVGTECRQTRMQDEGMHGPERYREMLASDEERRRYIIDADVQVQTEDLCFVDPKVAAICVVVD